MARLASIVLPVSIMSSAGRRADALRQAQHAAPAGEDAEHDFGQAHLGARLVDRQQVAAGQRQFETAAEAVTAHQRQRRVRDGSQAIEQVPAALDQFAPLFGAVELGEFLDVGAGDEAGRLAGTEDQARRRTSVSSWSRICASSAITSADSELADSPALSASPRRCR